MMDDINDLKEWVNDHPKTTDLILAWTDVFHLVKSVLKLARLGHPFRLPADMFDAWVAAASTAIVAWEIGEEPRPERWLLIQASQQEQFEAMLAELKEIEDRESAGEETC